MTAASAVGVQANRGGGIGFTFESAHQLAQLAMTGCFNNTFYTDGVDQMDRVLSLAKECEPEYVAKLAIYARKKGMMKDMPCFLTAYLATISPELLAKVFPVVINNGKMLRNFVGLMRSGVLGRKSLGTAPQRLVQNWFDSRTEDQVLRNSVGNDPSLADVIKLARPRPTFKGTVTKERVALYRYFISKDFELSDLPEALQLYLDFKKDQSGWEKDIPGVPFEMLVGESLTPSQWKLLAEQATWNQTRQALNTFNRHDVLKDAGMVKLIANKLRDPEEVKKSGAFPYQLFSTFKNIDPAIPAEIAKAIEDAMEIATVNIPVLPGAVYVCPDVSGSMSHSVTGRKVGKNGRPIPPSKVRCVDVGALVAASMLRINPHTEVIPFEQDIVKGVKIDPKKSILENAQVLASVGGGGTACSAPMKFLNGRKAPISSVLFISDYESWKDNEVSGYGWGNTRRESLPALTAEWNKAKERCPEAKMTCIDITPHEGTQAQDRADTLNVGGFSDEVFTVMANFVAGDGKHWVDQIQATTL